MLRKIELVDDAKNFWKFWSVRLGVIGSIVTGVLVAVPEVAISAWNMMPGEFKTFIPERYMPMVGVFIFSTSIVARAVKQKKLSNGDSNEQ